MNERETAWLRHQQQRFMRSDAARFIRPDAARFLIPGTNPADVYPALALKYSPNQPRVPAGDARGGEWTDVGAGGANPMGLPRVYISKPDDPDDTEDDEDVLSGLQLAGDIPEGGIGHNEGPPLDELPEIPAIKPAKSAAATKILRALGLLIGRMLLRRSPIGAIFAAIEAVDWVRKRFAEIDTYRDPPRTMRELREAVKVPRAGTEVHHIMERKALERLGLPKIRIDAPENLVRIPTLKHQEITGWYQRPNEQFGGLSPRQYLVGKSFAERMRVGRRALVLFEVLKP